MVVQFVGFLGAYRAETGLDPLLAGIFGALLTSSVTFVPCFFWIFLGAPFIERLRGSTAPAAALSAITAAVVGVVLNLAVWFSAHVLFRQVNDLEYGLIKTISPGFETFNLAAAALSLFAFIMILRLKIGMLVVLALSASAGVLIVLIQGGV